jgi:hypothetical protein
MNWIELFIFEIEGNKYKITYTGTEPITVNISTKLIGINEVESTIQDCMDYLIYPRTAMTVTVNYVEI